MAGQGIERREVLGIMARAAAAAQFPGFSRWAFACNHQPGLALQIKRAIYEPRFFTPQEYRTVEQLTDLIIPSDGTPGAREAGVSEFIDFMVWSDPAIQYRFRSGLTWLDAHSITFCGAAFTEAERAKQTAMLEDLAYANRQKPGVEDGRAFFALVREYTVMGFYTSRVGLEELDNPGLKMYSDSPACPHTDDPEHRRLVKRHA